MTIIEWQTWIANQGGLSSTPAADIQAILRDWESTIAEKDREIARLEQSILSALMDRDYWKARAERLEDVIRWVLGEKGNFPPRPSAPNPPAYYWRHELRKHAALEDKTTGGSLRIR